MEFKFKLASDATGVEFTRTITASSFPSAVAQLPSDCERRRDQFQDNNGIWRNVPTFADEQVAAGLC